MTYEAWLEEERIREEESRAAQRKRERIRVENEIRKRYEREFGPGSWERASEETRRQYFRSHYIEIRNHERARASWEVEARSRER